MINTDRLQLRHLAESDAQFILELLNTAGWKKYIGDRNVHSEQDALNYIIKINTTSEIDYRTVILNSTKTAIGLITLIKRDYLDFSDIGFAFLPDYSGKGYAYEAARAFLNHLSDTNYTEIIYAITKPENFGSIKLIQKLGLSFNKIIVNDDTDLHLYSGQLS